MRRRVLKVGRSRERLGALVAAEAGLSLAEATALVRNGAVYAGGRRCADPDRVLEQGTTVVVVLEEGGRSATEPARPAVPLVVLYEDAELIAVNKPAGITAQPTAGRTGESLVDLVAAKVGAAPGLVHRLDRETSGVTVFGKTAAATTALAAQFREGSARKRYLAVTGPGLPPSGTVDLPISADPSRPGRYRATRAANGVPAHTGFTRLFDGGDHCLVALFPTTGRTHQLRAHLTALGAPIAGDTRYGGARSVAGVDAARCLLHAQALALTHPRHDRPLRLEAPLPEDMARIFTNDGIAPPSGAWP